ncbi:MAG: GLPGLI family protein [Chitinophagaceae bacterium]|nr:GLPGLI family protein [Chitinophagaceae bacterium]
MIPRILFLLSITIYFSQIFGQNIRRPKLIITYNTFFDNPISANKMSNISKMYFKDDNECIILKEFFNKTNDSIFSAMRSKNISEAEISYLKNTLLKTKAKMDEEFNYFNYLTNEYIMHIWDSESDNYFDVVDILQKIEWQVVDSFSVFNNQKLQYATGKDIMGTHYFAWFSNEIPISLGPKAINGLPGLIIKLSTVDNKNRKTDYRVTKIEDQPNELFDFTKYIFSKKRISQSEFTKKTEDQLKKLKLMEGKN